MLSETGLRTRSSRARSLNPTIQVGFIVFCVTGLRSGTVDYGTVDYGSLDYGTADYR